MYREDGSYEQYPISGTNTNGGYNYFFDRQYYDLDKGYTSLNSIFNLKVTLPLGFVYTFNIAPATSGSTTTTGCLPHFPTSASSRGVNRENARKFDWNLNNTLLWDRTFNNVHHVTVTLVQEAEEHSYWMDRIEARNIEPSDVLGFHYTSGANKAQSNFSTKDTKYSGASYLGRCVL